MKSLADKIAKAIEADVTDRRGWRHEWDQFDPEVKLEIRRTWRKIIRAHLRENELEIQKDEQGQ